MLLTETRIDRNRKGWAGDPAETNRGNCVTTDWRAIEQAFCSTNTSARVLAQQHGVSHTAILKKSRKLSSKRVETIVVTTLEIVETSK
jgi:hypothetical protein